MTGEIPKQSDPQDQAKALVSDALAPVTEDLSQLNQKLVGYLPTEAEASQKVVDYIFNAGGKRVRPALYFMCCKLLGYKGEHYYPIAAVGEFVHTASLLHDDVVDNSNLRRGKPTANSIWGDETSVLVGDLIYSTASEMMAATGNMEIVKTFARAIRLMSDGELIQLENLFKPEMTEAAYFRILECKTAVLIASVCKAAGLLAGSNEDTIDQLTCFGNSVGLAFQLIDDALDYTAAAEILGKNTYADLPEGKVTLPVILAMQAATSQEQAVISSVINQDEICREDVEKVAALVEKYDCVDKTVERARHYTEKAMAALESFPAGPARDDLKNLAESLLFRFN